MPVYWVRKYFTLSIAQARMPVYWVWKYFKLSIAQARMPVPRDGSQMIDLRSDTVTKPTPAMREAMAAAEVGDDVFGEDPTVNRLQEKVAALLGKEAGLFMVSGSMSNQVAVKTHTQPGDEVILDREAHIGVYECGTPAAFSGVMLYPVSGRNGVFSARDVEEAVRPMNVH